jgi:hypothetical protein
VVTEGDASHDHSGGGQADGVRAEALQVVLDALVWQLAPARWQAVDQALAAMEAAVAANDQAALAEATADLEVAGPLRLNRIGDTSDDPPPDVRDRLNRLVYSLADGDDADDQQSS